MSVLKGIICLWSGAIVDIPNGWALCDGTQGTPDLRNQFVVGAGDTYNPDDSGGADSQTHTFTGDGHLHVLGPVGPLQFGPGRDVATNTMPAIGTTDASDNRPQYYALAYIMKL